MGGQQTFRLVQMELLDTVNETFRHRELMGLQGRAIRIKWTGDEVVGAEAGEGQGRIFAVFTDGGP